LSLKNNLKDRVRYLEILITSFVEHEKNLNDLIMKLEEIIEKISDLTEKILKERETGTSKKDLIFIKIKAGLSCEEQEKIREILNQ